MKSFTIVTFFLTLFIASDCICQPAICSYTYRKRITFDHTKVSGTSDLTDFPVLINIDNDNTLEVVGTTGNTGYVANSNGYDIVFTADDGVTLLKHQLIYYDGSNNNGDLQCWVKIPNLSASVDTYIYMYYGNSAISTDQSSTATWSNGYVGVWHFAAGTNSLINSTATSGLNGTNHATTNTTTPTNYTNGASEQFISSSKQYIEVAPYNSAYDITSNITVSAWIRLTSNTIDQKIAGNQDNTNGGWKFGVYTDKHIEFEIRASNNSSTLNRGVSGGTTLSTNTWYYAVGQYSDAGDFISTYLNGVVDRTLSTTAVLGASPGTMKFGCEPFTVTSANFNGYMQEVRLSNVIRSADWIATEYNNQNSPTTFYTISGAPKIWEGGSGTAAQRVQWSRNQNWADNSAPIGVADVILAPVGSDQPNLNTNAQVSSLWVLPSTTLTIPSQNLSVYRDITNCGVINCTSATGLVQLNSTSSYVQNQYLSGEGTYALQDLTINNTYGTNPMVILNNSSVSVSSDLVLTSGVVSTTSANILALGSGATSTSGSASSFVSGPMTKTGNTAFVFPVGKGTRWRRIGISAPTVNPTNFRAEYFDAAYTNTTPVNSPLNNVSTVEYWQLDRLSGTGNASVSLYWESASGSGINNCTDLTIARWSGTAWDERAGSTVSGSSCSGTGTGTITTTAVVTAFSPFTFGSKTSSVNVLPIELINFETVCEGGSAQFYWTTASETGNDYFSIEFSENGSEWMEVTKIKGQEDHSSKPTNYSYLLNQALDGYYRLSQVDKNGTKKIFKTLVYTNCPSAVQNNQSRVLVFPNPASNEINLQFELSQSSGEITLAIFDNLGQMRQQHQLNLANKTSRFSLPLNLPSGSYVLQFNSRSLQLPSQKLIIMR